MGNVDKLIMQARPKLSKAAPMVYWISLGYGVVNVVLGAGLYLLDAKIGFVIVGSIFTLEVWGTAFGVLGLGMLFSLYRNDWRLLRTFMILGLIVKLMWLIALIIRIADGGSLLLVSIWLFFAYIQVITIIFSPVVSESKNGST